VIFRVYVYLPEGNGYYWVLVASPPGALQHTPSANVAPSLHSDDGKRPLQNSEAMERGWEIPRNRG